MPKFAFVFAALVALSGIVPVPGAAGRAQAPTLLAASEVTQPDGWDAELALPQPIDLNPDPDILEFDLEATIAEVEIVPGVKTPVWTYNGLLPGPYIRAKVGDTIIVHFRNSLPEATTIHWHGLRVPNHMDGAPGMTQDPVEPGGTFRYEFVLRDAGTYWYHPHSNSAAQVGWGLYGPIVVEDPADSAEFGDDLVLMLSDMTLDERGQPVPKDNGGSFGDLFGREGNVLLVNGKVRPRVTARAGKPQRWRVINAARARYYRLSLPDSPFIRIGGDNGLAARSVRQNRLFIVPGERLDLVYTPLSDPGTILPLRWSPVNRGYGTSFGRTAETMLEIALTNDAPVTPAVVPEALRDIPAVDITGAVEQTLDLTITSEGTVVEMGINGVPSWKAAPLHARIGETHVWTITNNTPRSITRSTCTGTSSACSTMTWCRSGRIRSTCP